jgi:hypothetical protein
MTTHKTNNHKRSRRAIMRTSALCLLIAGLAVVEPTDAFVQQATTVGRVPLHAEVSENGGVVFQQALESKNASREKFGLKPLSVPQFLELQSQIADLEQEQTSKAAQMFQPQQQSKPQNNGLGNFAKTIFQNTLEDTCYTSFDCESPKVCCDLGFKKMCCSNGMMEVQHKYMYAPVPVDMRK